MIESWASVSKTELTMATPKQGGEDTPSKEVARWLEELHAPSPVAALVATAPPEADPVAEEVTSEAPPVVEAPPEAPLVVEAVAEPPAVVEAPPEAPSVSEPVAEVIEKAAEPVAERAAALDVPARGSVAPSALVSG